MLLGIAALSGILVFVLGVGNRFTRGPLFLYIPEVDLIPPLTLAAWQHAFTVHQQSPLYALCGGYQIGGMESLTVYQSLYLWEWVREGSVFLLFASLFLLVAVIMQRWLHSSLAVDRAPLLWLGAFGLAYLALRVLADHAGLFATLNLGQHRHAIDVTFASVGLALLLTALFRGDQVGERRTATRIVFAGVVALAIAFGALMEAMDAGVLWTSFPGYGNGLLPGADRLFALNPVSRNLAENGYFLQAAHRVLTFALWIWAAVILFRAVRHGSPLLMPALLLCLIALEGGLGAATLMLGHPVALSIAHQLVAVFVLAVALLLPSPSRQTATAS